MSKKHIVTILLVIGLAFVIYSSATRTQHGDPAEWMKKHGEVVNRRGNADKFCLKCHSKYGQTKDNFCNACHAKNNISSVK